MLQQMLRMRDAGQPLPDILGAEDSFLLETFYDAGLVESHDDIAAPVGRGRVRQYGLLLPLGLEGDGPRGRHQTGMSVTSNFDILYYNSAWFEEAGITVPFDSLDAVLEGMRAMKDPGPTASRSPFRPVQGNGVTTLKTVLAASGTPFEGPIPDSHPKAASTPSNWFLQAAAEELLPPEAIAWVRTRPAARSSPVTPG